MDRRTANSMQFKVLLEIIETRNIQIMSNMLYVSRERYDIDVKRIILFSK